MRTLMVGLAATVLGLSAALCAGCGAAGPGRYNVVIAPDPALRAEATPPTIAVDLIAVSGDEAMNWRTMPMSKYWAPDEQLRRGRMDVIKQFTFGPGNMTPQTLSKDDKVWDAWKGADTLFILARLPGGEDAAGEMDARRVILPLNRDRWDEATLRVTLFRNRLLRESQPKPEAKK